jgi:hypothetical protein
MSFSVTSLNMALRGSPAGSAVPRGGCATKPARPARRHSPPGDSSPPGCRRAAGPEQPAHSSLKATGGAAAPEVAVQLVEVLAHKVLVSAARIIVDLAPAGGGRGGARVAAGGAWRVRAARCMHERAEARGTRQGKRRPPACRGRPGWCRSSAGSGTLPPPPARAGPARGDACSCWWPAVAAGAGGWREGSRRGRTSSPGFLSGCSCSASRW